MDTFAPANPYKHHWFPAEIISHAVWLYFRFCLGIVKFIGERYNPFHGGGM
jgi:hypothetical protein